MLHKLAGFNSYDDRVVSVHKLVYKKEPVLRRSKLKRMIALYSRINGERNKIRALRLKRLTGAGAALAAAGGAYALWRLNHKK